MKKLFCCPALELFHCLPLWKTVLFVSSRAFLLSTPIFLFSTPVEESEATWKKATKCNKQQILRNKSGFLVSELVAGSSDQNIVVPTLFGMIKKLYYLFQTLTF